MIFYNDINWKKEEKILTSSLYAKNTKNKEVLDDRNILVRYRKWWHNTYMNASSGLPWWSSGQESACQHRGHGLSPWCRKGWIPHATQQLSLCATTTEPLRPRGRTLKQERPRQWKACAPQLESSPHSPQLEKAHMQQWRPSAAKN